VAAGVVAAGMVIGAAVPALMLGSSTLAGDGGAAAAAAGPAGADGGGFSARATSEPVTQSAAIAGRSPTRVRTAVILIIPQSPKRLQARWRKWPWSGRIDAHDG
jgi:hypothetical protein